MRSPSPSNMPSSGSLAIRPRRSQGYSASEEASRPAPPVDRGGRWGIIPPRFFPTQEFFAPRGGRRKKEMSFMKKFWTLGLAVVLGTALLTGCKKAEQTTTETTTTTEAPAVVEETGTTSTATGTESTMTSTTTTETTTTSTSTVTPQAPKQ